MPRLVYPLPPATIDDVARAAGCSPRTVRRYLAGHPVMGTTLRAIGAALEARGLKQHVRGVDKPASAA